MAVTCEPVEWDCEGCGVHVFGFGLSAVPAHQWCAVCLYVNEFVNDPAETVAMVRRLNGGWWLQGRTAR